MANQRQAPLAPQRESAFSLLQALFAQIEDEISRLGLVCEQCGRCCCFAEMEHILFATALEIDYLVQVAGELRFTAENRCPYQEGKRCTARQGRTLGCRLYFCRCSAEQSARLAEIATHGHARLRAIHEETGTPYDYAPFRNHLARKYSANR
ncbi:MAG: hypothetical protein N3A66_05530 [Planctomycetota bacterium]|nr:hypothetical protein [Planctomycetota bacterium]